MDGIYTKFASYEIEINVRTEPRLLSRKQLIAFKQRDNEEKKELRVYP
jgi:hypothetical protein